MGKPLSLHDINRILRETASLDSILMDREIREALTDMMVSFRKMKPRIFVPNPGPQTAAYYSQADVLLYGGFPGGAKTALLAGLALNEHTKSLIIRKEYGDVTAIYNECKKFVTNYYVAMGIDIEAAYKLADDGFSASPKPKFDMPFRMFGRIDFQGVDSDSEIDTGKQGVARDYIGVDEVSQHTRSTIDTLIGWNRSDIKGQRVRTVLAGNPPVDSVGDWICEMFAAWLDPKYPRPARSGELRFYYKDKYDNMVEAPSKEPVWVDGQEIIPLSYSFIPAKLEDNPFLDKSYLAKIQNLPAKTREIFLSGNFMVMRRDPVEQLIPSAWLDASYERWEKFDTSTISTPTHIGFDIAQGGNDHAAIAILYDQWFDQIVLSGDEQDLSTGQKQWDFVLSAIGGRGGDLPMIIYDGTCGWANAFKERRSDNGYPENLLKEYIGNTQCLFRTRCGHSLPNMRAGVYWKLREALDPDQDGGAKLCLPFNKKLNQQLKLVQYKFIDKGFVISPKGGLGDKAENGMRSIKQGLGGKSPDESDAVAYAIYGRSLDYQRNGFFNRHKQIKVLKDNEKLREKLRYR